MMGSTAMTYDLSEEKLMKLKYKSQHGDSEASFRLYQYYCFTKNNIYKQLRFLERSASQGNVTAQFNYGVPMHSGGFPPARCRCSTGWKVKSWLTG